MCVSTNLKDHALDIVATMYKCPHCHSYIELILDVFQHLMNFFRNFYLLVSLIDETLKGYASACTVCVSRSSLTIVLSCMYVVVMRNLIQFAIDNH